jgi:signal transduction histidine kinase/CheY-like chemotaxis protein
MLETPPSEPTARGGDTRLHNCIRDLAALTALPSMCVGRSPAETADIVMDALPTALCCDLVYVGLPGSPSSERASLRGNRLTEAQLAEVRAAIADDADGAEAQIFLGDGTLWCLEAEIPIGAERGRLITGRSRPLDAATDRVLVRSAANIIGATFETAKVLEAARRKDEFLAMLGHELRNPLAPIVTAVELLGRNASAAREQKIIDRHTRHLARLVDDLLDISRVTRGHVELRNEPVSLASVLEHAAEIAAPLVARNRHVLQIASPHDVTLQGDPVRLAQVFGNLLTNACKFTPAGGRIEVAITPANGRVRVTVRDNGRGIARDQLARIFEPFVQAHSASDALHGGLGLGLAIVRNLVDRHGGQIMAESGGPGLGASFTVELPVVAAAQNPRHPAPPQAPAARAGVRVLVVDDNVDIAELLSEALQGEGFETAVAHDGRTALALWPSYAPHAAVLDVGLPALDGYELAKALRAEHGASPILIAATGYGQDKDRLRAVDAGFDCHFVKPVSVDDLVKALDERVVGAAPGANAIGLRLCAD